MQNTTDCYYYHTPTLTLPPSNIYELCHPLQTSNIWAVIGFL